MHSCVCNVIIWYFKDICFPIKSKINATIFYFAKNTLFLLLKPLEVSFSFHFCIIVVPQKKLLYHNSVARGQCPSTIQRNSASITSFSYNQRTKL